MDRLNKRVLVTGANRGIGFSTCCLLAARGYDVTMVCRTAESAEEAMAKVQEVNDTVTVDYVLMDLTSLESVKECANSLVSEGKLFDVIILNAGIMMPAEYRTEDGFESTFQVNFLSQFLLVSILMEGRDVERPVKIVTVTSNMAKMAGLIYRFKGRKDKWLEMFNKDGQSPWRTYACSKYLAIMLSRLLNELDNVESSTVHPGIVHTGIADRFNPKLRKRLGFMKSIYSTPEQAAENVFAAVITTYGPNNYQYEKHVAEMGKAMHSQKYYAAFKKMSNDILQTCLKQNGNCEKVPVAYYV